MTITIILQGSFDFWKAKHGSIIYSSNKLESTQYNLQTHFNEI